MLFYKLDFESLRTLNIKFRGRRRATVVLETLGALLVETKLDMRSAPGKRVMLNFEDACISHVENGVSDQAPIAEENNSHTAIPRRPIGNFIDEVLRQSVLEFISTTFARNMDGVNQILAAVSREMYGLSCQNVTILTDDG